MTNLTTVTPSNGELFDANLNQQEDSQAGDPLLPIIQGVASNPDADVSKMEKLLEMRANEMERQAKHKFASDFAMMQAELPQIKKKGKSHNGNYAKFEHVNEAVQPYLSKYGFAISFSITQNDKSILVKAILMHKDGHSESTEISLPADYSGKKSDLHAIGSSTSYGKRYAMNALLNIVTFDEDDDGNGGFITESQISELNVLLDKSGADKIKFIRGFMDVESLNQIPASDYTKAVNALRRKMQG